MTKECYQIYKFYWKFEEELLSLVTLASLPFRRPIWLHSLHFHHNNAIKELSRGRCTRSKKQQTSPEMLIYRLSESRYQFNKKEEAFNYTL